MNEDGKGKQTDQGQGKKGINCTKNGPEKEMKMQTQRLSLERRNQARQMQLEKWKLEIRFLNKERC